ncbi:4-amino-4-deoxy-L-arabinose transferase-like glycosyltransferase [Pseudoduganella flava]|uniref:Glycosyltransferase n=1 Tax=Pseudoduganella flava TaxID=871742 RepID=A0A562PWE7_9BURK|nr:glycosyltransferase family 39 protein [Pseudoduganella flava]QGZ39799.1 glycosyltransferase [Pseudoduganella flava]TWI48718.1 4-amino-4-deoxy-L-arabinose transferase-like glycosyltransferase [Pseudoduganella flava]
MKPVRLPASAVLALPRWALFALAMLYILPGVIGREPWKNDDAASFGIMWTMAHGTWQDWLWPNIAGMSVPEEGPLMFWLGALCIKLFGGILGDVLAARIATIGVFLLGALALWYATFNLGRRPEAQPLRLAFGGQPEPNDFGRTLADAALLIYLGCLGFLQHSHETTSEPLLTALLALTLYRSVRYMEKPCWRNAALIGLALGLMTLTRGWVPPVFLLVALFTCTRFLAIPVARALPHLLATLAIAFAVTLPWLVPAFVARPYGQAPLLAWNAWNLAQLGLPSLRPLQTLLRDGVWFFWPAWPFALWAAYAWRRQNNLLHIVVPTTFVIVAIALLLVHPAPEHAQLLMLVPPLAIMAAFGLLTVQRGAINAIDWFSVMVLTLGAAVLWIFWYAQLTGWPPKPAHNVLRLIPGYVPEVNWVALIVAIAATLGWFLLVHWRVSRRPSVLWRAVVLSSGGVILIWILWMTLFLPHTNYSKSYATVARQAAAALPPDTDCIDSNAGPAQRASFAYFGKLPFRPVDGGNCRLLLWQDYVRGGVRHEPPGNWTLLWEGRRASDRTERFRLYRRPAP